MESMLETTIRVFNKRKHDGPPTDRDAKEVREYFERGCLCVLSGDLPLPEVQNDYVACLYFQMWCGCSRHYDSSLRYENGLSATKD